jgi:hypothetical protein
MPTGKTKVDIARLLDTYLGPSASIEGPDQNGDYTITVTDDRVPQEQLDAAIAQAALDILNDNNEAALQSKMKDAVVANKAFLAIQTPTNAQVVAQVRSLTRQSTAIIKMLGHDLSDTDGT